MASHTADNTEFRIKVVEISGELLWQGVISAVMYENVMVKIKQNLR